MSTTQHTVLSVRQREVIALLLLGRTPREMAADLCLSVATVRSHLQSVRAKTGTHRLVELALWGTEHERCCVGGW